MPARYTPQTMSNTLDDTARQALAERVRSLLMNAAANAWDDARISGLCGDGGWEIAYAALRDTDLSAALEPAPAASPQTPGKAAHPPGASHVDSES